MPETYTEDDLEARYIAGQNTAWRSILADTLHNLGYEIPEKEFIQWILEREATIVQLRLLCETHGDNDWPNDLHLADVIEKHLARHLTENVPAKAPTSPPESP